MKAEWRKTPDGISVCRFVPYPMNQVMYEAWLPIEDDEKYGDRRRIDGVMHGRIGTGPADPQRRELAARVMKNAAHQAFGEIGRSRLAVNACRLVVVP